MNSAQRAIEQLLRNDTRFKLEAYGFMRDALEYAQKTNLPGASTPEDDPESRHMTGQQLCEACRQYALNQYGYLAKLVLASWGLKSTSDFGDVVYNLIEIKHMRKSDSDRREDFNEVFRFDEAFEPSFELLSPEEA
jgi:uncharacterized repeat protein (TIGR04138 family)